MWRHRFTFRDSPVTVNLRDESPYAEKVGMQDCLILSTAYSLVNDGRLLLNAIRNQESICDACDKAATYTYARLNALKK